jgi:hypothetical protein
LKRLGLAACALVAAMWVVSSIVWIRVWVNDATFLYATFEAFGTARTIPRRPDRWSVEFGLYRKGKPYWVPGSTGSYYAYWLILTGLVVPTAILWYRDRRPLPGRCRQCGYDSTGNVSGRCPECGAPT